MTPVNKPFTKPERLRLLTEAAAPYRRIRKFIYLAAGVSGSIGGWVYLMQILAGRELEVALPTLALQLGIVAGAVGLNRLENRADQKLQQRIQDYYQKHPGPTP